jgi:hypothetical protein
MDIGSSAGFMVENLVPPSQVISDFIGGQEAVLRHSSAKDMLVNMREPNWKELRHAYGSAEDLPDLLDDLDPDPEAPVWNGLWSRVCHQYSTFTASPHVLPFLLSAAQGWTPESRVMPLALAGGIVAAPETNMKGFRAVVRQLSLLARDTLDHATLSRNDRVYVVQSVMAFEGDRVWGRALERLNDGEFSAMCPTCRKGLYVVVGDEAFCFVEDWVHSGEAPRSRIAPKMPAKLAGTGRALHTLCTASGNSELGGWICQLFGTSTCPNCSRTFDIANAIATFETR